MNFVGTIDQPRLARVAVNPLQERVLGIASRAVDLNGRIGGLVEQVGDMDLGHRNLLARKGSLVERPRGLHHQQAADLDLHCQIAEHQLDAFAVDQFLTEAFASLGIFGGDFNAFPG